MRLLSDKRFFLQFSRLAALVLMLLPFSQYMSGLLSPGLTVVFFVISAAAGYLLEKKNFRLIFAVLITAAVVFVIRFIVFSVSGGLSAVLDSAVVDFTFFRFDSGFFPLLPAMLYISLTCFLSRRKPGFIPVEIIINAVILGILLWKQGGYNITIFRHPGVLVVYCIIFIFVEISVILLSVSLSVSDGGRGAFSFLFVFIPIFLIVIFLLFGRYSEGASADGGGLMKPTLFRFDFSDYVKLETEISMDNDLVLLFRNYGYLNSVYLRRFYLSGYRPESGFYLQRGPGEAAQQMNLPDKPMNTDAVRYPRRIESKQEYFIVNFDPASLIAMNYPVQISPLTNWQASSFLRNYSVVSESVELPSWELSEAPVLDMNEELYGFYTDYGEDLLIKELALEITAGLENPYDQVIAIMFYLHDKYYYSLKPGVAADGNQLHYFLFDSRKGYCSYFAFSMALMCRSIGIPARVAAGFFIDPQSGILNIYPVREDMAHAWVEVPFEDFGWVEFDPTTDQLAPGEELEFSALDSTEYSELVEEIFANDYDIDIAHQAEKGSEQTDGLLSAVKKIGRLIKLRPGEFLLVLYILALIIFYLCEALTVRIGNAARRIRKSYRRALRLTAAFGYKRGDSETIIEHALRLERGKAVDMSALARLYLESVFSPGLAPDSPERLKNAEYRFFNSYRNLPRYKRLIIFLFPFFRFKKHGTSGLSVLIVLPAAFFLFFPQPLAAQVPGDNESIGGVEFYLESASREQEAENYEAALKLLNQGIAHYPENWELKLAAGNLYADRELYNLALGQYEQALSVSIDNPEILYQKSVSEGLLNLDSDSIKSLESLLSIVPDHYDGLADLGWMYFKTFRLSDAEQLLLGAIEIYDDSPILFMTLGTVYSGMYDYENAERYYLESIEMAIGMGWDYFASVAYYNLSLLENGFYNYEKSLEYTNKSIETGERAPGYISRAEIYLGKMDFETAYSNFQQAYLIDSTPLALMGLADLYCTFGLLDEALSHIQEVLKHDDESWMYYFGVDPDRHRMETDRILMEIYNGMARRERFSPAAGLKRLGAAVDSVRYYCLAWFHERRYRSASFDVGTSNELQGNSLDAAWAYFIANADYDRPALRYLRRAEAFEIAKAPAAEGSYLLEEGRLRGDAEMIRRAVAMLDPQWERLPLSEALFELVLIDEKNGNTDEARRISEDLYSINPGVFISKGIDFPLELDFKPGFLLKRSLNRSGFNILINSEENSYRYRLATADTQDGGVLYSVIDGDLGEVLFQISVYSELNSPEKISAFTAELKKRLFVITDGKDDPL